MQNTISEATKGSESFNALLDSIDNFRQNVISYDSYKLLYNTIKSEAILLAPHETKIVLREFQKALTYKIRRPFTSMRKLFLTDGSCSDQNLSFFKLCEKASLDEDVLDTVLKTALEKFFDTYAAIISDFKNTSKSSLIKLDYQAMSLDLLSEKFVNLIFLKDRTFMYM